MKLTKRLLMTALTFALTLGIAIPVQAMPQLPGSFDFTQEVQINLDLSGLSEIEPEIELIMALFGLTSMELSTRGSVVIGDSSFFMYAESRLGAINAPFVQWVDISFDDLDAPVFMAVVEVPAIFRLVIPPEFNRQFITLDAGMLLFHLAQEFDAGLVRMTESEAEEIQAIVSEVLAEALLELEEIIHVYYVSFGYTQNDGGYLTGLYFALEAVITDGNEHIGVSLAYAIELSNFNNAQRVELPVLTERNSLDLFSVLFEE